MTEMVIDSEVTEMGIDSEVIEILIDSEVIEMEGVSEKKRLVMTEIGVLQGLSNFILQMYYI